MMRRPALVLPVLLVLIAGGPLLCVLLSGGASGGGAVGGGGSGGSGSQAHHYWESAGISGPAWNSSASAAPSQRVESLPPADASTLVDLRHFSFLKSPPCAALTHRPYNASGGTGQSPLVVALVHSAPGNTFHRRMIRATWGSRLPLYFLVGRSVDSRLSRRLDEESRLYSDIIQGSFVDSYRNLTYKHVMGLKWVAYMCPTVRYILKTDDDVFVNSAYLLEMLSEEGSPRRGVLMCNVMPASLAKRSYRSKWRVSPVEYPHRWYPKYCAGWAVLYSTDVAFTLYTLAQLNKYFWIDDVHVTGTLVAMTEYRHIHLGALSKMWTEDEGPPPPSNPTPAPSQSHFFLFALTSPDYFPQLWQLINGAPVSSTSLSSTSSSSLSSPGLPP